MYAESKYILFIDLNLSLKGEMWSFIGLSLNYYGILWKTISPRATDEAFAPPPHQMGRVFFWSSIVSWTRKMLCPSTFFEWTCSLDDIFIPTPRPFWGHLKISIVDNYVFFNNSVCCYFPPNDLPCDRGKNYNSNESCLREIREVLVE